MSDTGKEAPLFSVVVLCYQNLKYLDEALDSILCQTYPAIELVVADDGSDRFDCAAVEAYIAARRGENLKRVQVYQNPENLGTVANLNTAIGRTGGKYLKFLGADDALYGSDVLEQAARVLERSPDGVAAAKVMKCDAALRELGPMKERFLRSLAHRTPEQVWRTLCVHNDLPAVSLFFCRSVFERYGLFDTRYRLLEDWPTWLRLSRIGVSFTFGDFFAVRYRSDTGAATAVNPAYLADKQKTYETEIFPYRHRLGFGRLLLCRLNLRVRDSVAVRRIYGMIFRRK